MIRRIMILTMLAESATIAFGFTEGESSVMSGEATEGNAAFVEDNQNDDLCVWS